MNDTNSLALSRFTVPELLEELKRRKEDALRQAGEIDEGLAGIVSTKPAKALVSPLRSKAKAEYWAGWHTYREQHPGATVEDWRESKTAKTKTKTKIARPSSRSTTKKDVPSKA